MSDLHNGLRNALNLPDVVKEIPLPSVVANIDDSDPLETDYNEARGNLKEVIGQGKKALESLLLLAEGSDQPRAYEVVGQLIKTISDVSKDLVDLQKKVKEIRGDDHSSNNPTVVNNAVFIGSTADLQAIINGRPNIIDGESSDV
jgi:hypothetical protein